MRTNNKLREAVKETQAVIAKCMDILNRIPDSCGYGGLIDDVADELCDLRERYVQPALAEPVRNCDLYKTKKEAQEAFLKEPCDHPCGNCWVEDINNECGVEWLLAHATEKEGGTK